MAYYLSIWLIRLLIIGCFIYFFKTIKTRILQPYIIIVVLIYIVLVPLRLAEIKRRNHRLGKYGACYRNRSRISLAIQYYNSENPNNIMKELDMDELIKCANCGVNIIASIHAKDEEDFLVSHEHFAFFVV